MVIGQIYTTLDRIKTSDNLYCIGEFKKPVRKIKKKRCIAKIRTPETK